MVNTVETIWKKVDVRSRNECWPFKGRRSWGKRGGGYGRLDIQNVKGVYAHRAAFLAANPGAITLDRRDGILVLHSCDNPICCNPQHLRTGTHKKNMRDKVRRGRSRWWGPDNTHSPAATLTADDVRHIRKLHADGASIRDISDKYMRSRSCIDHIIRRLHFKDID